MYINITPKFLNTRKEAASDQHCVKSSLLEPFWMPGQNRGWLVEGDGVEQGFDGNGGHRIFEDWMQYIIV